MNCENCGHEMPKKKFYDNHMSCDEFFCTECNDYGDLMGLVMFATLVFIGYWLLH
jgi:hypothetical protein